VRDRATISTPAFSRADGIAPTLPPRPQRAHSEPCLPRPLLRMNLRSIPGTSYPSAMNFSNLPCRPRVPPPSCGTHRIQTTRRLSGSPLACFDGSTSAPTSAHDRQIASADKMRAPAAVRVRRDRRGQARRTNSLAIRGLPLLPHDLAITLSIGTAAARQEHGPVARCFMSPRPGGAVRFPAVATRLNSPQRSCPAHREGRIKERGQAGVEGVLKGKIESLEFSQPVRLGG